MSGPKGNLTKNPGFESGLQSWEVPTTFADFNIVIEENVEVQNPAAHSGCAAAALGAEISDKPTALFQDVPVAEGRFYELHFHIAAHQSASSPLELLAEVRWLNRHKGDLGSGLVIYVPRPTIGDSAGHWGPHARLTSESPENVAYARISFTAGDLMWVDDVQFADQS